MEQQEVDFDCMTCNTPIDNMYDFEVCCECGDIYCAVCADRLLEHVPRKMSAMVQEDMALSLIEMEPDHYYCQQCFVLLEERIGRKS